MKRLALPFAIAAVALAIAACSSAGGSPSGPPVSVDPDAPSVVAKNLLFDKAEIDVPAGKAFQLAFNNDEAVPHNVSIYTNESASQKLFEGEIFNGPSVKVYNVSALQAGTYFFRCDVHPNMKGSVVAK